MGRKAWLLLAVIPVLLGAYALKRFALPAPVTGGETSGDGKASVEPSRPSDNSPKPGEPVPVKPAVPLPADFDPFALLQKDYDAHRAVILARLEESQASRKAGVQPALDAAVAEFKLDLKALQQMDLDAKQKNQKIWERTTEYQKEQRRLADPLRFDLEQLQAKTNEALGRLEADRTRKRNRLVEVQTLVQNRELDPAVAKQTQFEILDINLPPSGLQPSAERPAPTSATVTAPSGQPPTVGAIIATPSGEFCALIEDALVYHGSFVQGYLVRKINADSVEFEKNGQTWVRKVD